MKVKTPPFTRLTWLVLLVGLVLSPLSLAAQTDAKATDPAPTAKVEFVRDKNYACTQCHKDDGFEFEGTHATTNKTSKLSKRPIGCVDCHGKIGPEHRDGGKQVKTFSPAQTQAGTQKPAQDPSVIAAQNQQCTQCHAKPEKLREGDWTHDVHAKDLSCASCHQLHPKKDPMKDITHDARIAECVDCHGDQTKAKQALMHEKYSAAHGSTAQVADATKEDK